MIEASTLYDLIGVTLVIGVAARMLADRLTTLQRTRGWSLLAMALAWLPWASWHTLALEWRGAFGAPSATLVALATLRLIERPLPAADARALMRTIALTACLFYPFSLGVSRNWGSIGGYLEPYGWGLQPQLLIVCLGALALYWLLRGHARLTLLAAFDLGVYALRMTESANLWDMLIDPVLALICLVSIGRNGGQQHIN